MLRQQREAGMLGFSLDFSQVFGGLSGIKAKGADGGFLIDQ